MNRIKRFDFYKINEAQDITEPEKFDELSLDRFPDLKEEIMDLIKKSLGSDSRKLINDFIEEFNRDRGE